LSKLSPSQIKILDCEIEKVMHWIDPQKLAGKSLFITGGTGFFGLWLLSALRVLNEQGTSVQVSILSRNPDAFLRRCPQFRMQHWLNFITGDVRNFPFPKRNYDLLIHAATETSMAAHADPNRMFENIIFGSRRVLDFAVYCGASRILQISSGAVYGPQPQGCNFQPDESQLACNPLSPASSYGEGKRVMELMGAMLQNSTDIECVVARCFSFCGPGLPLDGHFAIGNFVRDAIYGDELIITGDGTAVRSYLHGADLAMWLICLLLKGEPGKSYNVGSDKAICTKDLAIKVGQLLAPQKPIKILQKEEGLTQDRHYYVPSIARSRKLGCAPWTQLDESIIVHSKFVEAGLTEHEFK
jgi:dTDP-glucose 4,6-dehydratase